MANTTALRMLRTKYGIHLQEIAEICGTSNQYVSAVELGVVRPTENMERTFTGAMAELISRRKKHLASLEETYLQYQGRLLQPAQEDSNGTYGL